MMYGNHDPEYERQKQLEIKRLLFYARQLQTTPSKIKQMSPQELQWNMSQLRQKQLAEEEIRVAFKRWQNICECRWLMFEEQCRYDERTGGRDRRSIWSILALTQKELEQKLQLSKLRRDCPRYPSPMSFFTERELGGRHNLLKPLHSMQRHYKHVVSRMTSDHSKRSNCMVEKEHNSEERIKLEPSREQYEDPPSDEECESEREIEIQELSEDGTSKWPHSLHESSTSYLSKFVSLPIRFTKNGMKVPAKELVNLLSENNKQTRETKPKKLEDQASETLIRAMNSHSMQRHYKNVVSRMTSDHNCMVEKEHNSEKRIKLEQDFEQYKDLPSDEECDYEREIEIQELTDGGTSKVPQSMHESSTSYLSKFVSLPIRFTPNGMKVPAKELVNLLSENNKQTLETKPKKLKDQASETLIRAMNSQAAPNMVMPGYVDPLVMYVKEKFNVDSLSNCTKNSTSTSESYCSAQEPPPSLANKRFNKHNWVYCPLCDSRHLRIPPKF